MSVSEGGSSVFLRPKKWGTRFLNWGCGCLLLWLRCCVVILLFYCYRFSCCIAVALYLHLALMFNPCTLYCCDFYLCGALWGYDCLPLWLRCYSVVLSSIHFFLLYCCRLILVPCYLVLFFNPYTFLCCNFISVVHYRVMTVFFWDCCVVLLLLLMLCPCTCFCIALHLHCCCSHLCDVLLLYYCWCSVLVITFLLCYFCFLSASALLKLL